MKVYNVYLVSGDRRWAFAVEAESSARALSAAVQLIPDWVSPDGLSVAVRVDEEAKPSEEVRWEVWSYGDGDSGLEASFRAEDDAARYRATLWNELGVRSSIRRVSVPRSTEKEQEGSCKAR